MARRQRLPKLPLRRTTDRRPHSHQSPSARPRGEFRGMGRLVLDVRLCGERVPEEGGSVECEYVFPLSFDREQGGGIRYVDSGLMLSQSEQGSSQAAHWP